MSHLWTALVWLLSSKKRVAALAAVLFALGHPVLKRLGLDVTMDQVAYVVGALAAYIVGQGLADLGKETKALETKRK